MIKTTIAIKGNSYYLAVSRVLCQNSVKYFNLVSKSISNGLNYSLFLLAPFLPGFTKVETL